MRTLWVLMLVAILVSPLSSAQQGRRQFVVAKSGAVFNVANQKLVGHIKLNDKPPVSIMQVSFDPVANNLYIVDQPFLEHGGIFILDAKSLRQKKFLSRAEVVYLSTFDSERTLGIQFTNVALNDRFNSIDRKTLELQKTTSFSAQFDCLLFPTQSKLLNALRVERTNYASKFYMHECFSRDGVLASQMFSALDDGSNGFYAFRQVSTKKPIPPFILTNTRLQEGECTMNVEKAICFPWQLSKQSRAELIDLSTGQIRKIPTRVEDAPIGSAAALANGKDFIVMQVGNNTWDFRYYIASDATNWDLRPYDELNKIKGEWLVGMYEIER